MTDLKKIFKNKKITVMGLGLLGGALNDIVFLAKCGADITVTDLKTKDKLLSSFEKLKKYKNIKYTLGHHDLKDFKNADMVLQPGNVPINSPFLEEARKHGIPIFVSESLFVKYAPEITIVGVTGTRGKSMTTALIYEILSKNIKGKKVYLGGNVRNVSTLALLEKVKAGDIVVMELDSWALHGTGDIGVSPQISVFTTFMPDHMNYYGGSMKKYFADKANIFKYQKKSDLLVIRPGMKKYIKKGDVPGKFVIAKGADVSTWPFRVPGAFQRENLACAVFVARAFKIPLPKIKKAVSDFKGIEGRLQYLRTVRGVKIYNDNNATTPEATIAGLEALGKKPARTTKSGGNIILICGGADKGLELSLLEKTIKKYCKAVVLLSGTGTNKLKIKAPHATSLKAAIQDAMKSAQKGDILLFSPAFASFGMFANEYDRNDQFVKIIKKLK